MGYPAKSALSPVVCSKSPDSKTITSRAESDKNTTGISQDLITVF